MNVELSNIAEPEETIEATLVALLAESVDIPVEGVLAPAEEGEVKRLSSETVITVAVDQTSQDGDYRGPRVPHTYSALVAVHYAIADDANGADFRLTCRIVRGVLVALTGDGCENASSLSFVCDEFMLDSTSTSYEGGDNPVNTKTYTATLKGRVITTEA